MWQGRIAPSLDTLPLPRPGLAHPTQRQPQHPDCYHHLCSSSFSSQSLSSAPYRIPHTVRHTPPLLRPTPPPSPTRPLQSTTTSIVRRSVPTNGPLRVSRRGAGGATGRPGTIRQRTLFCAYQAAAASTPIPPSPPTTEPFPHSHVTYLGRPVSPQHHPLNPRRAHRHTQPAGMH